MTSAAIKPSGASELWKRTPAKLRKAPAQIDSKYLNASKEIYLATILIAFQAELTLN